MGRFGHYVIDADGHGGEPLGWRRRIPKPFEPAMRFYVESMRATYGDMKAGGLRVTTPGGVAPPAEEHWELGAPLQPGMHERAARIADMDLEGIDVAVLYPPGAGEEWALGDVEFAAALCRTLNDARAEFASFAPERFRLVAKLAMLAPKAAARELQRYPARRG